MNIEAIRKAAQEIRSVLQETQGGYPDDNAKQRISSAARDALRASDYDAYINEKVTSIISFADTLYSHRKFRTYDTPQQDGASRIRSIIHTDANNLDRWASQAEPK